MGLLGTIGKAALGAAKGSTSGGGMAGAISGAAGEVSKGGSVGVMRNPGRTPGGDLGHSPSTPMINSLSGGSDASSAPVSKAPDVKSKRSVSGRRGFTRR